MRAKDTTQLFSCLCAAGEDYLIFRAGDLLKGPRRHLTGRGQEPAVEWKPLAAPAAQDYDLGAITHRSSELVTLQHRLLKLERRIPRLPPDAFGPPVPDYCVERRTWALACGLGRKLLPDLP